MKYLRLVSTTDLSVEIGDEEESLRLEIFQDSSSPRAFIAKLWQEQLFRMKPNSAPRRTSSESFFVEMSWVLERTEFESQDADDAFIQAIEELNKYINRNNGT